MAASENKVCPQCAETVKNAAHVCRFCQYTFNDILEDEIKKIADAMYDVGFMETNMKLHLMIRKGNAGGTVTEEKLSTISKKSGLNKTTVKKHLESIGYTIVEDEDEAETVTSYNETNARIADRYRSRQELETKAASNRSTLVQFIIIVLGGFLLFALISSLF